jgi:hypothetical protein
MKGDKRMTLALSDIIGIAQAIVLAIGLSAIFFEYRNEKRSRGYATYVQTALAHIELQKWFVDHPEAFRVFSYDPKYKGMSKEEIVPYEFCAMLLVNFEIIYQAWKNKWMKPEEWQGWKALIEELIQKSSDFSETWKNEGNLYSKAFQDFVNALITSKQKN